MNLNSTEKQKWQFSNISNLSTFESELDSDLDKPESTGQRRYNESTLVTSPPQLDLNSLRTIVSQDYGFSDIEHESAGSDREARGYTSDQEQDGEGQLSDLHHE